MNCFKRKLFLVAAALLVLGGCATNEVKKAEADAVVAMGNARVAEAQAAAEEAKAVQLLASKIDAGGASAYLIAKAMKGLGGGAAPQQVAAQPQNLWGMAFNALLAVADRGLQFWGIKAGRDVAIAQSNNSRDVAMSTNQAFLGMGSSIERAGIAGYPFVQAPGAITNTNHNTWTLSGTGVLGNGTYQAPVTNTNCNGGTAAPGGSGTTGGAGPGGSAPGGTC